MSPTCIKARSKTPSLLCDTLQNAFPLFLNLPLSGLVWEFTGSDSGLWMEAAIYLKTYINAAYKLQTQVPGTHQIKHRWALVLPR